MSKPSPKIILRGIFVPYTAYGMLAEYYATALLDLGYKVKCYVVAQHEAFGATLSQKLKDHFAYGPADCEHEIVFATPGFPCVKHDEKYQGRRIMFTMWETTRLPSQWIEELNKCYAIIVPNEWNRKAFKESGITRPIHIVPLYVTGEYYPSRQFPQATVFGAAARMSHGGVRKGMDEIIAGFQRAFPVEHEVMLRIKIFPDCNLRPIFDSRIQVIRAFLDHAAMREWYHSLSAFVSASRGEGWNLHLHEAMACGKPGVACDFSGHTTFFTPDHNGYAIDYKLSQPFATEYHQQGEWADPSVDSIAARMREIHENPGEAFYRGVNAAKSVAKFTPQHSLNTFIKVLQDLDIV